MDYEQQIADLKSEAINIRMWTIALKDHLQSQFCLEFDEGSRSHNRGLLYAQCGTSCQAITHLLNGIISDLDLVGDLPLQPKEGQESNLVQVF